MDSACENMCRNFAMFPPPPQTFWVPCTGKIAMIAFSACVIYEVSLTYVLRHLTDTCRQIVPSEDSGMDGSCPVTRRVRWKNQQFSAVCIEDGEYCRVL